MSLLGGDVSSQSRHKALLTQVVVHFLEISEMMHQHQNELIGATFADREVELATGLLHLA